MSNKADLRESLYKANFMDKNHDKYSNTRPIDVDAELRTLKKADYKSTRALLTAFMREEDFVNGAINRRIENGDLLSVLKQLKKLYKEPIGEIYR
nr:DUF6508 domain-containing protein [Clostridium paridis]